MGNGQQFENVEAFDSLLIGPQTQLIKEGDIWVIKSWVQIRGEKGREGDMRYFNEVFAKMSLAEKRYGVKDLSKWAGLKE